MVKRGFLIAAGVLCFVLAGYIVWIMFSPSEEYGPELPPVRMRLAEKIVPRALGDMRGKLPPTYFRAVLLQFEGHRNAHDVRKMVEDEVVKGKILNLKDLEEVAEDKDASEGWLEKAKAYATKLIGESVGIDPPTPDEKIRETVKAAGMDGFVWGKVHFVEDSASEERLELTLFATDVTGKKVFESEYSEAMNKSLFDLEYYRIKLSEMGMGWKLLIWLVFTLGLPVVTFFVPAKVLKLDSNGAVLAALVGYTVVDGLVAIALMGFAVSGILSFFVLLVSLVLAGVYNYGIFTEIKDFV
ncbi:MAG: hypothetical protein ACYTFG_04745 [Planctomycetota bacterium]|jgi:hypothetical protein